MNKKGKNKTSVSMPSLITWKIYGFHARKTPQVIDSFQFTSTSLDKPVSNLPKKDHKYTSETFTGDKLSLMSQKGVYPYDYMDCFEKFN